MRKARQPGRHSFRRLLRAGWVLLVPNLLVVALPARGQAQASNAEGNRLTFDEVARTGHEATYGEVANQYGGPISEAPAITVKAHPELIRVLPNMAIEMQANPFTFGVGDPPQPVPWRLVQRSLEDGHWPVVISTLQQNELMYEQVAFAALLKGGGVKTGHEKQAAMVRMSVTNLNPSETRSAVFYAFIPGKTTWKGMYDLFEVLSPLPPVPAQPLPSADGVLRDGAVLLGVYQADPGVRSTAYDKVLKFEMDLRPGQKQGVIFKVSSNKKGFDTAELGQLRGLDYLTVLGQRKIQWAASLEQGTKITVPEEVVNHIYKAQILSNQMQMVQAADRDYYMLALGYNGVWPWEAMKTLVPLDAMGFGEDVAKLLQYFIKMQGRFPPHGQVNSYDGFFSGTGTFEESGWENDYESTIYGAAAKQEAGKERNFPSWMNWTGTVLYGLGEHYFYTNDRTWLQGVSPALLKACNWIIREREQTKQMDARGQKVLQYGLLPAGQAYDTKYDKPTYYPGWTDGYTYLGLERAAEALADIGHPEVPRLLKEAASYREDILEVMRRTRQTDPDQPPYPERLYQPPDWADFATGPLALLDTGFIKPNDPAFSQLEAYMKKHFNRGALGLTGALRKDGDSRAPNGYYVAFSEDIWQRAWMLRGETEKALLAFYSTLAYAVDKATLGAVERFDLTDRRYAPFFMDGESAARVNGMIRQTLLFEQDKTLYLLAGAPRRWLEPGKTIEVRDAMAYFGKLDMDVVSRVDQGEVLVDLKLRKTRPERLELIRLRVPHPARKKMRQVLVNGRKWDTFSPEKEVIELKPSEGRYHIVVQYRPSK